MKANAVTVRVQRFWEEHGASLGMEPLVRAGMDRVIREPTVNRPGLALAGFRKYFAVKRVQVVGNVETSYLKSLDPELRLQRYRELFSHRIPCVVICRGIRPEKALLEAAEEFKVPVFRSGLITMRFINVATAALESLFARAGQMHGCMVDIQGVGVVIQGESGIGKSEAVLGLIERGHSLVADDVVKVRVSDGRELVGTAKDDGRNMMEVRGIGIIDVAVMFGVGAIRREKRVDLLVNLKRWEETEDVDRLGLELPTTDVLGLGIPTVTIPVRPGRDLARLVEVAAFQTKLRLSGYNAAEEFTRRLTERMQRGLQL